VTPVLIDLGLDEVSAQRLPRVQRLDIVLFDQPRPANNVSERDRDEASRDGDELFHALLALLFFGKEPTRLKRAVRITGAHGEGTARLETAQLVS
jgi:hypothetical protein